MSGTNTGDTETISAVICTRNRPDKIGTAVASVLANDHDDFSLTVIDQSTDDQTRAIVEGLAKHDSRLTYEHMDEAGLSKAYNRGIARTSTDIIAFTDDDCVAPTGWLRAVEAAFVSEPDGDLLYGQVIPLESGTDETGLTPQLVFDRPERLSKGDGFRVFGMGANFAARRRLFDAIGGFDEILGGGGPLKSSQDFDLAYRVYKAGRVIVLRPEVTMRHDGRREAVDWPTLLTNYGFGDGAFYTKHVRCRDPYTMWLFSKQAGMAAARLVVRTVRRQSRDSSYLRGMGRGARSSFDFPVNRAERMYIDPEKTPARDEEMA